MSDGNWHPGKQGAAQVEDQDGRDPITLVGDAVDDDLDGEAER